MSDLFKLRRPAVLITLFSIIEILTIILNFKYAHIILVFSVIFGAVFSFVMFGKDRFIAIICTLMIILPALSTVIAYNSKLLPAKRVVKLSENAPDTIFTANVYDHNSYGIYNVSFVKITHIDGERLSSKIKARVCSFGTGVIKDNAVIKFSGVPTYVSDIENDSFNSSLYLFGKGAFLEFENASITDAVPGKSSDVFSSLRNITKSIIYKYVGMANENNEASLSYAIFAGDSSYISNNVQTAFYKSGTIHILCVSGMHLAILCSFIFSLLTAFTISKRNRCLIIVAFCIFYTIFTGFSLSTLRASIMCIISYLGSIYGKKSDGYISLFLSLYIITLVSPFSIFDISLILSFFATLGLIVTSSITPKLNNAGMPKYLFCSLTSSILRGMGATCFTLAFCAFLFGNISLYQVISTLIMSLPSELLLSLLFCLILLSPLTFTVFGNTVLGTIGYVCRILSGLIIKIAHFFSSLSYSSISSKYTTLFLVIFLAVSVLITLCISFGKTKYLKILSVLVMSVCLLQVSFSLYRDIKDDKLYKVQYFRQNQGDRQLSVKLGREGYFLVNADNRICHNTSLCAFDENGGKNYLLIIPDKDISSAVLAENIKGFDRDFGLKGIYLPRSAEGKLLLEELTVHGIVCMYMPSNLCFGNIHMKFTCEDYNSIFIDDTKTSTNIVFAEKYDSNYFYAYADINAFFTRKTENQFDIDTDIPPDGERFFTRLKKNQLLTNAVNTFGQKSIMIKG